MSLSVFSGKRVFLTGHTGFKGAWMLQVLHGLGAEILGYSLPPEHSEDLYHQINGDQLCHSILADINDQNRLKKAVLDYQPDFVFHLAAQALVRRSYRLPIESFSTNVMGTAHVLEAIRALQKPCVGVMITTDKVYENPEQGLAFTEEDKLGGYDPYSASKAAAEIVIESYRRSFFNPADFNIHRKAIASVRAGNVIGGGDFSEDRLIPDIVRALRVGEPVTLRNPQSVRPWQHVLEPIFAYLLLAEQMMKDGVKYSTAFNIGPERSDERTVAQVTNTFYKAFGKPVAFDLKPDATLHEAGLLMLDNTRIKQEIGWQPRLTADQAIQWSAAWYSDQRAAKLKCQEQIATYQSL
ncbi:MAG: CDP-glucose 4,6-dehydratase [Bacteroidetes bacterium]|nr:CDP-glucose 4,6-dehydratase [Bacteroidota bacterium]